MEFGNTFLLYSYFYGLVSKGVYLTHSHFFSKYKLKNQVYCFYFSIMLSSFYICA